MKRNDGVEFQTELRKGIGDFFFNIPVKARTLRLHGIRRIGPGHRQSLKDIKIDQAANTSKAQIRRRLHQAGGYGFAINISVRRTNHTVLQKIIRLRLPKGLGAAIIIDPAFKRANCAPIDVTLGRYSEGFILVSDLKDIRDTTDIPTP